MKLTARKATALLLCLILCLASAAASGAALTVPTPVAGMKPVFTLGSDNIKGDALELGPQSFVVLK